MAGEKTKREDFAITQAKNESHVSSATDILALSPVSSSAPTPQHRNGFCAGLLRILVGWSIWSGWAGFEGRRAKERKLKRSTEHT